MTETRDRLTLIQITPEMHDRTCGYWYLVQSNHSAYTAFATLPCLVRWLDERGLSIDDSKLSAMGQHSYQDIKGKFVEHMTTDRAEFDNLPGVIAEVRQLDNGDYTLGKVTIAQGVRTVHWLNCNVRDRVRFPYFESDALCCGRVTAREAPMHDAELDYIRGGR